MLGFPRLNRRGPISTGYGVLRPVEATAAGSHAPTMQEAADGQSTFRELRQNCGGLAATGLLEPDDEPLPPEGGFVEEIAV